MKISSEKIYISCDCGSEVLVIERDKECGQFCLSIYELHKNYDWKSKIMHIWRILRHGTPYGDQIVIDRGRVMDLIYWLNSKV